MAALGKGLVGNNVEYYTALYQFIMALLHYNNFVRRYATRPYFPSITPLYKVIEAVRHFKSFSRHYAALPIYRSIVLL